MLLLLRFIHIKKLNMYKIFQYKIERPDSCFKNCGQICLVRRKFQIWHHHSCGLCLGQRNVLAFMWKWASGIIVYWLFISLKYCTDYSYFWFMTYLIVLYIIVNLISVVVMHCCLFHYYYQIKSVFSARIVTFIMFVLAVERLKIQFNWKTSCFSTHTKIRF